MRGSEDQLVEDVVSQVAPAAPAAAPALPQHGAGAACASDGQQRLRILRAAGDLACRPAAPAGPGAREGARRAAPVRRSDRAVDSQLARVATDRRLSRYKTTAGAMAGETAEAQKDASAELAKSQSPVLSVSNVRDVSQAKRARGEIAAYETNLLQGITDGTAEQTPWIRTATCAASSTAIWSRAMSSRRR